MDPEINLEIGHGKPKPPPTAIMIALVLIVTAMAASLDAQPSFHLVLPELALDPGETADGFVIGDLQERTEAFSLAFIYDPSVIEIEFLSTEDTALEILNRGRGPEIVNVSTRVDLPDGRAGAFFVSIFGLFERAYLPPGENFPMLHIGFRGVKTGVSPN